MASASTKRAWGELLEQYCKLDTLSMVLIIEYCRRVTGLAAIPLDAAILPDTVSLSGRDAPRLDSAPPPRVPSAQRLTDHGRETMVTLFDPEMP
jgi:hypothetical protein